MRRVGGTATRAVSTSAFLSGARPVAAQRGSASSLSIFSSFPGGTGMDEAEGTVNGRKEEIKRPECKKVEQAGQAEQEQAPLRKPRPLADPVVARGPVPRDEEGKYGAYGAHGDGGQLIFGLGRRPSCTPMNARGRQSHLSSCWRHAPAGRSIESPSASGAEGGELNPRDQRPAPPCRSMRRPLPCCIHKTARTPVRPAPRVLPSREAVRPKTGCVPDPRLTSHTRGLAR